MSNPRAHVLVGIGRTACKRRSGRTTLAIAARSTADDAGRVTARARPNAGALVRAEVIPLSSGEFSLVRFRINDVSDDQ